jgi:hypothetical protein
MKTFSTVEEYLEVIAGKRSLEGKRVPTSGFLFGSSMDAIISLARYDVSFLDSVTENTMSGQPLTDKQAELACRLIFKYQKQLASKGVSVEPMAVPIYRVPLRIPDRSRTLTANDDHMVLKFPYDQVLISQLRELLNTRQGAAVFNKEAKHWRLDLTEYNLNFAVTWAQTHKFEVDPKLLDLLEKVVENERTDWTICLKRKDDTLYVENAHANLVEYLEQQGITWGMDQLLTLVDWSSVLGYQVDAELMAMVEQEHGADITSFTTVRDYSLSGDYSMIPRLLKYAQAVGRLPLVVYDPSPADEISRYYEYMDPAHIQLVKNEKTVEILPTAKLVLTRKPLTNVQIPLLVSHSGMTVGSDRSLMMQNTQKVIYFAQKLNI